MRQGLHDSNKEGRFELLMRIYLFEAPDANPNPSPNPNLNN